MYYDHTHFVNEDTKVAEVMGIAQELGLIKASDHNLTSDLANTRATPWTIRAF